ncbi:hypothetical protein HBI56_217130 [Parastagonospora nodorum]|uniref:Uncharacterized protein n=1 Tax=Phaeosphaeria nodorum (strain SN15 / ATCC MYA-4574 / FGSC 10173) TaxID=321614 RepID=A0A7U2HZD2_PHANO|nr:hypothetical protein HBH56_175500 [Parastagonospora nodorum]QRC96268.1 hypothetical protein JI435_433460 [Parastagonospora nodorum SN15]KAH3926362.1 hypothetical protein HBH54_167660 [Parastagonospora nodorum]KAH3955720.1 hypothetical protein HBH53_000480 [Parastagonospora nodorum]KAH3965562.1 hypothetical protein HBH52_204320 [Parastagonospora nodorum]
MKFEGFAFEKYVKCPTSIKVCAGNTASQSDEVRGVSPTIVVVPLPCDIAKVHRYERCSSRLVLLWIPGDLTDCAFSDQSREVRERKSRKQTDGSQPVWSLLGKRSFLAETR